MAGVTYEVLEREPLWAAEEAVRLAKGQKQKSKKGIDNQKGG